MIRRTPLAWKNLVHAPRRLLLATAGVGFAAVLMFTQNGFKNALLDSPIAIIKKLDCDLVAVSTARYMLSVDQRFPRNLLRRALADPAVDAVEPVLIERLLAQVRVAGHPARAIRVISVPNSPGWLDIDNLEKSRAKIQPAGTALVDRQSRVEYQFEWDANGQPKKQVVELAKKRIRLVGTIQLGTDFANEGTLMVREQAFADYFPIRGSGKPLEVVDVGMIRLKGDGAPSPEKLAAVANRLEALAEGQWVVMTPKQLETRETEFWKSQTPVGKIFSIGTLMGFIVGVIICYQILYTSLQDAMPEFATLKAMGYPNRFFVGLVTQQSVLLSLFGFIPALIVTFGLYWSVEWFSGLPMRLNVMRAGMVLLLTTAMCLTSGMLALRKLLRADPASLF
ncbi:putative ABC transport system permease protein [Neorhodopirellula lusitana]|uniref:ABC transport system permease protein n=1 Tax=Neorhodopirellula lusitana TaxID=445327 RepID=A0ABY1QNS4_9BACT|nr:FtsX-like permease family protein [Neorhodopirellula lusitana]SMP76454.1 putative ABC transport system permease protein [Neorhodopirellula lusitana]